MSGARCTVSIANSGQSFSCAGVTILDSAIAQGIQLPYNCRGGACGTCKADVLEGSVQHGLVMGFAISDEEIAQGKCLICSSRPLTERLLLRMHNAMPQPSGGAIIAHEHEAEIVAAYDIAESVRRVTARLRHPGALRFDGGMYMEFVLEGVDPPRPYSIATTVDRDGLTPDGLLDFLIARHDRGMCSTYIHTDLRVGAPLVLRGPYGTFRLPEPAQGKLLMLAGGTGLAPLISIATQQLARGYSGEIDLFFSVRTPRHVFFLDELHRLAHRHPSFRFRVFVTRAGSQAIPSYWEARRITDYLRQTRPRLDNARVLIAGAPGFVRDSAAVVTDAGVPREAILLESYEVRR